MFFRHFFSLFKVAILTPLLFAQDGGQLYTLYCSACHGSDGLGATGGAFPPLAESSWVDGDPDRAIKIVLNGLNGPVEVSGKTYNLEMPPQGAMLQDDQIAAILTFVRSSWGNQAPAITSAQVKATRAANIARKTSWTAEEILKLHPFPIQKTILMNLTSQVYQGEWKNMPDFKTLKAKNIEEEHDGIISLKDSLYENDFGMVWDAKFEIPTKGKYLFYLDADDAGRILIDDELVLEIQGNGPLNGSRAQKCIIELDKGSHRFRVEYIQNQGNKGLAIGWRPSSKKKWNWLTDQVAKSPALQEPILIEASNGRAVIHRNFILGTSPRAIGVGFPGGVNLAYSADDLGPALIWQGPFIDGAKKWLERGTADSPPAGEKVIKLSDARSLPSQARFRGYKLDAQGNPTFSVQIGKQYLLDSWHAESGTLVRKLTVTGGPLEIKIAQPPGISIEGAVGKSAVKLNPGQPVTLTYRWN